MRTLYIDVNRFVCDKFEGECGRCTIGHIVKQFGDSTLAGNSLSANTLHLIYAFTKDIGGLAGIPRVVQIVRNMDGGKFTAMRAYKRELKRLGYQVKWIKFTGKNRWKPIDASLAFTPQFVEA